MNATQMIIKLKSLKKSVHHHIEIARYSENLKNGLSSERSHERCDFVKERKCSRNAMRDNQHLNQLMSIVIFTVVFMSYVFAEPQDHQSDEQATMQHQVSADDFECACWFYYPHF